jgi:hypothetical protein
MRQNDQSLLTESAIRAAFERGFRFPPLEIRLRKDLTRDSGANSADARLEATWEGETFNFIAEFKSRARPVVFKEAIRQVTEYAQSISDYPMIVLPYLQPQQLDELQQQQISGIDMSGNGVVIIPNRILVYRTGKPNKFPESIPVKYAYRGTTSLVGRAFLCRRAFGSLADIESEIGKRGVSVATSTISKALKRMEEDLIVERRDGEIQLLQADKLLLKMAESFRPPKIRRKATYSTQEAIGELLGKTPSNVRVVLSGRSSVGEYAVMGRDEPPVVFTDNIDGLLEVWKQLIQQTSRFVDFELQETDDPTVYFDARDKNGLPYASPIQVFLECWTGDKRERETAEQVRDLILKQLAE